MDDLRDRVIALAQYIADTGATVRQAAAHFGISKSTVHKDMTTKLFYEAPSLYGAVRKILDQNKAQRHVRGGEATKRKYENRRKICPPAGEKLQKTKRKQ